MDINIIAGKTSEKNNEYIFSILRKRDKSKKHIIIAPDRSLFSFERRLFDETGESCFFDVSVTSISKLSKSLLSKVSHKNVLTKQSGVALVKKLLNDNKDKLHTFKKSTSFMGFASTLFETICLYKSCNISCDDVYVDDSQNHSNLKQKDIKLIYSEYEKYLQTDFTDSFNQLALFTTLIDRDFCKDTIFYFVEFDDFTSLMYGIIEKLARFSDKFYVCASFGKENNNSNIYSNKVYYDLITLFKTQGLSFSINKLTDSINSHDSVLQNNLLSYNKIEKYTGENNKIKINSFENTYDEIKYSIAKIYETVLNDASLTFSDFSIVLPNLNDYINYLKRELSKYDIPYFIDKNDILVDHILIRTLFNICAVISGDFSLSDFTSLIKSELLNLDNLAISDYDNLLHRLGAKGYECLNLKNIENEELRIFVTNLLNWKQQLKNLTTAREFLESIIIEIYNYLLEKSDLFIQKISPLEKRIFDQVTNKFEAINKDYLSVFSDNETKFDDFIETYKSYFETTNISLPPITSNTLFIADFNSSYISTCEHMYIFGCNEGIFPKFKLDNGLVTDEEIARLPNANKINPTIAMLNSRKTFKLFELVFKAKKSLTLSFLTSNSKGKLYPNNLILSLLKILDIRVINGSAILDQINNSFYELDKSNILFNNLTPAVATNNILTLIKNWETYNNNPNYRQLLSSLFEANYSEEINRLINNSKITGLYANLDNVNMFKNSTTSISQIETYYNCPYMHYARYGLRLVKKQEYKIQANDIGTIIHAVLKIVMPDMLNNLDDIEDIIEKAKTTLTQLLNSDAYKVISNNPTNAYIIKSLYNEIERVCIAVINEIKASSFKPSLKHLEYNFNSNSLVLNGIKIRGSIDRIDTYNDDFIVIDYKTGDNSFDNYNDVFSGKKLQLLVYAKAFEIESGKNLKGVYYLPLSNAFSKEENSNYRFRGVTYKSKDNILALDNNLTNPNMKSQIINLTTTKTGEFYKNNYYNNLCLEKEDLDYLLTFAISQVDKAIKNIIMGDINPHPIKNGQKKACKYCDYKGLCNYLNNNDNITQNISNIQELKEKEGNNGTSAQ